MERIRENAAGIDIGSRKVFVSIEGKEVKCFFTFTEDFEGSGDCRGEGGVCEFTG